MGRMSDILGMLEDAADWLEGLRDGTLEDGAWPHIDQFIEEVRGMQRDLYGDLEDKQGQRP